MSITIPPQNLAIFLQKFSVTAPGAASFLSNYSSVGVMTTNAPQKRQWQFTFNGSFISRSSFEIVYDFSKVNTYGYSITFEGDLNGFLTIDGKIYAADKYLSYIPQTPQDIENKVVRLRFRPPCPRSSTTERSLYYVTNLNDSSCSTITLTSNTKTGTTWSNLDFSQQYNGSYNTYSTSTNTITAGFASCTSGYDITTLDITFSSSVTTSFTFNISNLGSLTSFKYKYTGSSFISIYIYYPLCGGTGLIIATSSGATGSLTTPITNYSSSIQSGTTWGTSTTSGLDFSQQSNTFYNYNFYNGYTTGPVNSNSINVYAYDCTTLLFQFEAMSNPAYTFNISNLGPFTNYYITNTASTSYSGSVTLTINTPNGTVTPSPTVASGGSLTGTFPTSS